MFLQIHTLTSYPASLLNRDDAGLAKRIPFGNATRLRVSSQCLKRHWRDTLVEQLPELPDGQRTRSFFTRTVLPKAIEAGIPEPIARSLLEPLAKAVVEGGVKEGGDLSQPVLFGLPEANYFVEVLKTASQSDDPVKALSERLKSKEEKDNLKAMRKSALGMQGLTASLFGRMVTSDLLARVDAPVHVAHAFTVHAAHTEMDYFTVVDDLSRDDETGAAHANQTELGAGVFYGYVVVDVPLLVSNLTGCERKDWRTQDASVARRVLEKLIDAIMRQSPGAKLGSTAPYAHADFMLMESGTTQPRALANAFLEAVPLKEVKDDLRKIAVRRLADYLAKLDGMYGGAGADSRRLATVFGQVDGLPLPQTVPSAVNDTLAAIFATR
ncbi:MAG: type I-E CRISPR-associated protein Cas7/Cse4/CasC [Thiohalomonadaceae bacterium]